MQIDLAKFKAKKLIQLQKEYNKYLQSIGLPPNPISPISSDSQEKDKTKPVNFNRKYCIVDSGCWEWVGSVNKAGYGSIYVDGKNVRAHRYSYLLHYGPFDGNLFVCHKCDNPKCVNPEHLFLGTCLDNTRDSVRKGRFRRKYDNGHLPGNSLIKDSNTIRAIKNDLENRELTVAAIADKFCLPAHLIKDIKRGRSYSKIKPAFEVKP
jgi:hypothetical protein